MGVAATGQRPAAGLRHATGWVLLVVLLFFVWLKEARNIPCAMQHPNDTKFGIGGTVEGEVPKR